MLKAINQNNLKTTDQWPVARVAWGNLGKFFEAEKKLEETFKDVEKALQEGDKFLEEMFKEPAQEKSNKKQKNSANKKQNNPVQWR